MECKINELSATRLRLNVMYVRVCVCAHDSLMVGVERAAALHAKPTPQAVRVSMHRAQEEDNVVGRRSRITVPLADSDTHASTPSLHFLDFFQSIQLQLMAFISGGRLQLQLINKYNMPHFIFMRSVICDESVFIHQLRMVYSIACWQINYTYINIAILFLMLFIGNIFAATSIQIYLNKYLLLLWSSHRNTAFLSQPRLRTL